jgi:putative solute:sodium symporter small subunit
VHFRTQHPGACDGRIGAVEVRAATPDAQTIAWSATRRRPERDAMETSERHRQHWSANLRITAILLAVWLFVTFGLGYFARDLNFTFFGWPFSFWVASQGALVVYGLIVWFYSRHMSKLDRQYGVDEDELP